MFSTFLCENIATEIISHGLEHADDSRRNFLQLPVCSINTTMSIERGFLFDQSPCHSLSENHYSSPAVWYAVHIDSICGFAYNAAMYAVLIVPIAGNPVYNVIWTASRHLRLTLPLHMFPRDGNADVRRTSRLHPTRHRINDGDRTLHELPSSSCIKISAAGYHVVLCRRNQRPLYHDLVYSEMRAPSRAAPGLPMQLGYCYRSDADTERSVTHVRQSGIRELE